MTSLKVKVATGGGDSILNDAAGEHDVKTEVNGATCVLALTSFRHD